MLLLGSRASSLLVTAFAVAVPAISKGQPAGSGSVESRLQALEAQNQALQAQLEEQNRKVQKLESDLEKAKSSLPNSSEPEIEESASDRGFNLGAIHISGEGGVGWFSTGSQGQFPEDPFRVDEAKLFLEAPLWEGVYFFTELDLVTRETQDEFFRLGELYVEVENLVRNWEYGSLFNLRAGRIDIPFGEEYLARDVIDNPLISHSLSDVWGVDEGAEIYGKAGKFDYVFAIQNGGHPTLIDGNSDKAIAGRLGFTPNKNFRFSFSGMRTGDLSPDRDRLSEVWFGNGFFRSLGQPATTTAYGGTIFELDGQTFWKTGHVKAAAGYAAYDDDDSSADNARDGWYYYVEGMQQLTSKLYVASRFSQIIANDGLPLVGHGKTGTYLFGPLTTDLWRLSIGLGYPWNDHFITKLEYTLEQGELLSGSRRSGENFVGAELGFKF